LSPSSELIADGVRPPRWTTAGMRRGGPCTRMVVGGCIRQHRRRGWPLRGRSDAAAWRGPASRIRRRLSPCGSPLLPFSRHGRGEAGLDLRRGGLPWCRHLLLRRATSPCRPSHACSAASADCLSTGARVQPPSSPIPM
jgi:hypothetical protein